MAQGHTCGVNEVRNRKGGGGGGGNDIPMNHLDHKRRENSDLFYQQAAQYGNKGAGAGGHDNRGHNQEPDETTMYIMNKDGLMETVTTTDVAARMTDQGSLLGMRATQDGTTLFGDGTMGGVGNRPSAPPMHGGIQGNCVNSSSFALLADQVAAAVGVEGGFKGAPPRGEGGVGDDCLLNNNQQSVISQQGIKNLVHDVQLKRQREIRDMMKKKREKAVLVDRISRWLFPTSFILLNIVYWALFGDHALWPK